MPDQPHFESIVEVAHTKSTEKANGYLKLGWVLLNVESNQYSEHGWSTAYALGWKKETGGIQYLEPSEWEKLAEEAAKDPSIPF